MRHTLAFTVLGALVVVACQAAPQNSSALKGGLDDGPEPSTFSNQASTTNFDIYYNASETSDTELVAVESAAETAFGQLSGFLGRDRTPTAKLTIELEGDALQADHTYKYPHVGSLARIHLYRYPGQGGQYEASLTHEMVHAFRVPSSSAHVDDWDTGFGFVEEAFAEYVARSVQPIGVGFTNYGYSLPLVAGQWLERDLDVPLTVLSQRHVALSLKCMIQSYPERASFFFFLESTYGKGKLADFTYGSAPIGTESYASYFGQSLDSLATSWRAKTLATFSATPNSTTDAATYWNNTPAKYFPYCKAGIDY